LRGLFEVFIVSMAEFFSDGGFICCWCKKKPF